MQDEQSFSLPGVGSWLALMNDMASADGANMFLLLQGDRCSAAILPS
jgi:hypothetical protein